MIVSVPYRGATFLNGRKFHGADAPHKVSVPYRGATFLNSKRVHFQTPFLCFRPLSGSYISQYIDQRGEDTTEHVSVPYRGATFLNELGLVIRLEEIKSFRPLSGSYISQSGRKKEKHE